MPPIDWLVKLRVLLQVLAFCLAVSAIQFVLQPERAYEIPLVYSLLIGTCTWAFMDFGRHVFPSSAETGWPRGLGNVVLLVGAGIVGGNLLGTLGADSWFGWSSWDAGEKRTRLANSIVISLASGLIGSYYFYSRNRGHYLERKMDEVQRQAGEARLRLLESQLEPHMLFNTLANLRALIATDPVRATAMLDRMIAYLRATLAASRGTSHPLQAEFDRLRDYLELMTVRMGSRLHYTLELPAELAAQPVPPLLLQPLVENCIRHGLEPKVAGGEIHVTARRDGPQLQLEVSDTGVGPGPAARDGGGFGLAQVRERLGTAYGDSAAIELIANAAGGTTVSLTLPAAA